MEAGGLRLADRVEITAVQLEQGTVTRRSQMWKEDIRLHTLEAEQGQNGA